MRNSLKFILFTVVFALVTTFTLSCSEGGNENEGGNQINGDSSSSINEGGSSSSTIDGSNSGGSIKKEQVGGVSQKGPFVEGSTATLYELNDDFSQTGRSFMGIITDNKGTFEIKGIELISPYAMLEVSGYYRNEVTGQVSTAPITLLAIADITEKDNINVNILTHLEYYRVLNLVESGDTLAEAKKQAQEEILAVFGINGDDFGNSEDMSIFGNTEGDAALLAISVLLQGNLGEGEFSQRLTNFSQAIKNDGTWNNERVKTAIADWAYTTNLAGIKNNILGWGLSLDVPDFGKYVTAYWTTNYGLDACDSSNDGEIQKSNRDVNYICKSSNWVVATEYEVDTYQWEVCSDANVGEIKTGNISGENYVCKYGSWKSNPNYKDIYCSTNQCQYFIDSRDNQQYAFVKINYKFWMAENLNYNAINSRCYGDNTGGDSQGNCMKYGRLYDWNTAMGFPGDIHGPKVQGVCPDQWHLPSRRDWDEMIMHTGVGTVSNINGNGGTEGTKLKATSGWDNNGNGTDDYGFSALPGGYASTLPRLVSNGSSAGSIGYWWSTEEGGNNPIQAYAILSNLAYPDTFRDYEIVMHEINSNGYFFSVRCIRD